MRGWIMGAVMVAVAGTTGCAMNDGGATATAPGTGSTASVTLVDVGGVQKGRATLRQTANGVELVATVTGMAPGPKGLHFHTTGRCDAPDFTTAGAHWNPGGTKHGRDATMGPHRGDLPNIEIGTDGSGRADATIAGATLTGGAAPLLDADGAALIVHAAADDYRTDPSGNSGARLACGVVTPA